jgi:serine protease
VLLDRPAERIRTVLDRSGLRPEVAIPQVGVAAVEPAGDRGVASVRHELRGDPAVAGVEPEYRRTARLVPDDPAYSAPDAFAPQGDTYQWHLRDERFPRAWNRSTGAGARLAVIDSGVDGGNPDLGSRIVAAVDQDGRVDSGPATVDEDGHGTHVAGLACATGDNGYGGASSGFGCELIVEKTDLGDASIVNSIIDATRRGADVINMSFGGPGASQAIEDAVSFAWKRDVVMVAAASNENTIHQGLPARALQPKGTGPMIRRGKGLVVTAAEYGGSRAWFRPGKGKGVSLAAYGAASASPANPGLFSNFPSNLTLLDTGIPPRVPPCHCRASFEGDIRFAYMEGTSMAVPQVAGAAALIRARRPGIDAKSVIEILKQNAGGNRFRRGLGWGVLDAGAATRVALKQR